MPTGSNPNSWNIKGAGPGRPPGQVSFKTQVQQAFLDMSLSTVKTKAGEKTFLMAYLDSFKESALKGGWAARDFGNRLFAENILEEIDRIQNKARREDMDFLAYRILKDCHDVQQKIILSKSKHIYLMAGRRAGKSEVDVRKALTVMTTRDDARVLFIGLSFTRCMEVFWNPLTEGLSSIGADVVEQRRTDGYLKIGNGSEVHFKGNTSVDERDKIRGSKWDLVIIDEVQNQKALPILIEEIIEPTLLDRNGQLILSGTGPKVRGTYWEELWTNIEKHPAARFNWSIKDNPFIPNYEKVLDEIKEKKGLTDKSPLFLREYLGQISYDDDALVYRLNESNIYTNAELAVWIDSQPITDIHFTAGLDYGWSDADAFGIIMYSDSRQERFLVYEHKGRRQGIAELVEKIREGIAYINSTFPNIPNRDFYIYADAGGGGKKISVELATTYGLPTLDAYKVDKNVAIETLQEEVRIRSFKVRDGSIFADEALKTVFSRNEADELTREIDDETFHPDFLDAVLYALRMVWINSAKK